MLQLCLGDGPLVGGPPYGRGPGGAEQRTCWPALTCRQQWVVFRFLQSRRTCLSVSVVKSPDVLVVSLSLNRGTQSGHFWLNSRWFNEEWMNLSGASCTVNDQSDITWDSFSSSKDVVSQSQPAFFFSSTQRSLCLNSASFLVKCSKWNYIKLVDQFWLFWKKPWTHSLKIINDTVKPYP